jgi:NAD(P)-dependent dehydrogenase (short-subunit alcohol dehydrogenase family)
MSVLESFKLDGKVALVTGASSGLGHRFAEALADAGAAVAIAARRTDRLAKLADSIGKKGGRAHAVALDVMDVKRIPAAIAEAERALGPIDILVNNSGTVVAEKFLEHSEANWDKVIDTNLKGVFLVAQAVAKRMVARGKGGSIVNIASTAAFVTAKGVISYNASKAAVVSLTKSMALELARHKIRVNAICPGYVISEMTIPWLESDAGKAHLARVPMRRAGQPEELDGLLILLASDAGGFMTGSAVIIDGGESLEQA